MKWFSRPVISLEENLLEYIIQIILTYRAKISQVNHALQRRVSLSWLSSQINLKLPPRQLYCRCLKRGWMNPTTPEKCIRSFPSVASVHAVVWIIFLLLYLGLLVLKAAHSKVITIESIKCSFPFTGDPPVHQRTQLEHQRLPQPIGLLTVGCPYILSRGYVSA